MASSLFVEIGNAQRFKHGQDICGDAIFSQKIPEEDRLVSVLSDGLGSGIKANVLASMTARMAFKFVASNMELVRSSEIMMDALPICQVRRISYATFTIIDCIMQGKTQIIEMDNPPYIFIRDGKVTPVNSTELSSPKWKERTLHISSLDTQAEDRIIVFSDGVSQAGIGTKKYPLGWRNQGCSEFVQKQISQNPTISARDLANAIVDEARAKEPGQVPGDDISCSVLYFRKPRKLLILTGPPFHEDRDAEFASYVEYFDGKTAICGGTTSNIIERELCRKCEIDKTSFDSEIPAASIMDGIDLVTEGILTLTSTYKILKEGEIPNKNHAAARLAKLFIDSDDIKFLVGTKINNAHQDPSLPIDLEIRRNIVKKIVKILKLKYLKEVNIEFI